MSYTALYRKWRPQTFVDVCGQNHIVKTLKNQLRADRITHAYLFCGTRGTGKTSMAKIFAKAVNCEQALDFEPCGVCKACSEQNDGISLNVYEIDAASNNGVDNIREIREDVKYPPTYGRYKIYIIDEVHMLSMGAFNALLKTLEEPPAHVIFILATTDPHKIPPTIHSRCQRFDFKRITVEEISNCLNSYMLAEKINVTKESLNYIARLADGSMRDALSILDQCVSFYFSEDITLDKVLELTGSVDTGVLFRITDALNNMDLQSCLDIVDDIILQGRDIVQFTNELIEHFRNLLISKVAGSFSNILNVSNESINILKSQAVEVSEEKLMYYIRIFSEIIYSLKNVKNPRILLEVTLIKIIRPANEQSYDALLQRIIKLEKDITSAQMNVIAPTFMPEKPKTTQPKKNVIVAVDSDLKNIIDNWSGLRKSFNLSEAVNSLMEQTELKTFDGKLYIVSDNYVSKKIIQKNLSIIVDSLINRYQKQFIVEVIDKDEINKLNGTILISQYEDEFESIRNVLPNIEIY